MQNKQRRLPISLKMVFQQWKTRYKGVAMNSNGAAHQMAAGTPTVRTQDGIDEDTVAEDNVREIFPGARRNTPVMNHSNEPSAGPTNEPSAGPTNEPSAGPSIGTGTGTGFHRSQVQRFVAERTKAGLEGGMATAEYAIATLAAVGFAGLLVVILKSDEVRGFLLNIIRTALSF